MEKERKFNFYYSTWYLCLATTLTSGRKRDRIQERCETGGLWEWHGCLAKKCQRPACNLKTPHFYYISPFQQFNTVSWSLKMFVKVQLPKNPKSSFCTVCSSLPLCVHFKNRLFSVGVLFFMQMNHRYDWLTHQGIWLSALGRKDRKWEWEWLFTLGQINADCQPWAMSLWKSKQLVEWHDFLKKETVAEISVLTFPPLLDTITIHLHMEVQGEKKTDLHNMATVNIVFTPHNSQNVSTERDVAG